MNRSYQVLVGLHFVICTLAMIWPGALIANRIEPTVLGMPFLLFWYVAWILVLFVGTAVAYWARHGGESDV